MKKGPPRAPPNGPDCTISKRGRQAKKEKKFRAQAADLARFLNRAKVEGLARKLRGGDLARFLSGRFYAKASNSATADTFLEEKFTFRKVGTLLSPEWRILMNCKSSANANE